MTMTSDYLTIFEGPSELERGRNRSMSFDRNFLDGTVLNLGELSERYLTVYLGGPELDDGMDSMEFRANGGEVEAPGKYDSLASRALVEQATMDQIESEIQ